MKTVKSFGILLLLLALCFSIIGCQGKSTATAKKTTASTTSANASKPLKSFSVWTWLGSVESWGGTSYEQVLAYKERQKQSGVDVKYVHPTGDAVQSFNLMMSSGKMTDTIWYHWSPDRSIKYYDSKKIINIAPLVKKYAPNLMKIINSNPKVKKQLFDPQGRMFYMPWLTLDNFDKASEGLVLRKDWLDKIGAGVPTTTEQLYQDLKKMKEQDVSGSKKFVGLTGYPSQIYKLFYGFGVADDWYLEGNKVTYGPITDKYKKGLKYLHKLYAEGLLDKDYLTSNQDIYDKKLVQGMAAGFIDNTGQESRIMKLAKDSGNPFQFVPVPYFLYNGKPTAVNSAMKRMAQPYGLAISTNAKNPAQIVKFLDYGYSQAGETLFNWGVKGDTFKVVNGKKEYTDKVMKDPEYPPETAVSKYTNSSWVTVTDPEAQKQVAGTFGTKARELWAQADTSRAMEPLLWMTDKENQVVQNASTDIDTYHQEMRDAFITGKKDIDKNWNAYVQTLKSMGIDKIQKAQQAAYDRFSGK